MLHKERTTTIININGKSYRCPYKYCERMRKRDLVGERFNELLFSPSMCIYAAQSLLKEHCEPLYWVTFLPITWIANVLVLLSLIVALTIGLLLLPFNIFSNWYIIHLSKKLDLQHGPY